ncbi:MAG: SCO2322 family protein [Candidatus Nanopelagicales bacterium]
MTVARRRTTTALAAVVVGVLAALSAVIAAPPAQASTYRYWTYWWAASNTGGSGGWKFASVGPAGHRVNDTWVLGWRFATTTSTTGGSAPRMSSSFSSLCPDLAPVAGKDRVALVLDYGTTADAPPGQRPPSTTTARVECLTITSHPTGLAVLNTAGVDIRSKDGLVCALDGYPKGECAPLVADPTPTPTPSKKPTPAPSRTSAAPVVPVTGGSPSSTAGTARTSSTPTPAASSSGPAPASSSPAAVTDPATAPSEEPTLQAASGAPSDPAAPKAGPGSPVATVLGTLAVVALAGAAFWISRRRS